MNSKVTDKFINDLKATPKLYANLLEAHNERVKNGTAILENTPEEIENQIKERCNIK